MEARKSGANGRKRATKNGAKRAAAAKKGGVQGRKPAARSGVTAPAPKPSMKGRKAKSRGGNVVVAGSSKFTFTDAGVLQIHDPMLNKEMNRYLNTSGRGAQIEIAASGPKKGPIEAPPPSGTQAEIFASSKKTPMIGEPPTQNSMCVCDSPCPPG